MPITVRLAGSMATSMGFFQRLRSSGSSEAALLEELAVLAGKNLGLVERMRRHAEICPYPNIKAGVAALAEKEARHVKALNAILSDRSVWAKLPELPRTTDRIIGRASAPTSRCSRR